MPRRKAKVDEIVQWAQAQTPNPGGSRCGVCSHEEITRAVAAIVDLRARGVVTVTKPQLYRRICETYPEWKCSWSVLRDHIDKHTKGWNGKAASR